MAAPAPVTDAAEQQPQPSSKGLLPAGLIIPKRPAVDGSTAAAAAQGGTPAPAGLGSGSSPAAHAAGATPPAAAPAASSQPAVLSPAGQLQAEAPAAPAAGLEVQPKKRRKAGPGGEAASPAGSRAADSGQAGGASPASQDGGPRLLSRAELVAQQQQQRHAAGLAADLDALARARQGAAAQAQVRLDAAARCERNMLRAHQADRAAVSNPTKQRMLLVMTFKMTWRGDALAHLPH